MRTFFANLGNRAVDVHPDEVREMWFGFAFNFIVLASYYVIRPIATTSARPVASN